MRDLPPRDSPVSRLCTCPATAPAPLHAAALACASLSVGMPHVGLGRAQVASGLRPLLDGLDWLQAKRHKTVLHIRAPGEDDAADRREIEKRGLKSLSLEVSPQTLSPAIVEQFN